MTTGAQKWSTSGELAFPSPDRSQPAELAPGLVIAADYGVTERSGDEAVFAVDEATGRRHWLRPVPSEPMLHYRSDVLIVGVWPSTLLRIDPVGMTWQIKLGSTQEHRISEVALGDASAFVIVDPGDSDSRTYAVIDLDSGATLITGDLPGSARAPEWHGDRVLLRGTYGPAGGDGLLAIEPLTGALVWSLDFGEEIPGELVQPLGETTLLAGRQFCDDKVSTRFGLLDATGALVWEADIDEELNVLGHAALSDNMFILPTSDSQFKVGRLIALDAETGTERWTLQTQHPVTHQPLVTKDGLVVSTGDVELSCD